MTAVPKTLHLQTRAYRAHDPRWSFQPISGRGAAITGGRFNVRGQEALYLALDPITALAECTQGFANRMQPLTLCEYDVDVQGVVDLTAALSPLPFRGGAGGGGCPPSASQDDNPHPNPSPEGEGLYEALSCPWLTFQRAGRIAPSQAIARDLVRKGANGALVPSFAPGVRDGAVNLVLWKWSDALPCRVMVYDPDGRLGDL
jgi:RES domain-containing protein